MTKKEKAVDLYSQGFLCSQSILVVYAKECGISEVQALKLGKSLEIISSIYFK